MSTVLYRFDSVGAYPLLSTFTTARNPVLLQIGGEGDEAGLNIGFERNADDEADIDIVLGLPLSGVDGAPRSLQLDLVGNLTGCRIFLEGMDSRGAGLTYALTDDRRPGRQVWVAGIQHPSEYRGALPEMESPPVLVPLQFHRLSVTVGPKARGLDLRLLRLRVTGDIRLCPPGIADRRRGTQLG